MDLSALLLSQNVASMPGGNSSSNEAAMGENASNDFGNLLNLVENMETAEMNGQDAEETLANLMKDVSDPELQNLNIQKSMAQSVLLEEGAEGNGPAENMLVAANLSAQVQGEEPNIELQQIVGSASQVDSSKLASMGAEQGIDDLNLDEIIEVPNKTINQINVGQRVRENDAAEMLSENGTAINLKTAQTIDVSSRILEGMAMSQGLKNNLNAEQSKKLDLDHVAAWSQALASKEIKSVNLEGVPDAMIAKKAMANAKSDLLDQKSVAEVATSGTAKMEMSSKNVELKVAANTEFESAFAGLEDVSKEVNSSENVSQGEAVMAKDFMLSQMAGTKVAGADSNQAIDTSKISKEITDFVSEQVDQLQQSGNESLRVQMDSKDLGGLSIKVTMRGGLVDVDIRADDAATQSTLNASSSQLKDRLTKAVDLGELDIATNVKNIQQNKIAGEVATASLSQEVLKSLGKVESSEARVFAQNNSSQIETMNRVGGMNESHASNSSTSSRDFGRDDKREHAMNQWQQFINLKQSA